MITDEATLLQRTSLEGISMWSRWQPDRQLFFNSFFIRGKESVIVDPLPLEDRHHEVAVLPLGRRHERLEAVVEPEQPEAARLECGHADRDLVVHDTSRPLQVVKIL